MLSIPCVYLLHKINVFAHIGNILKVLKTNLRIRAKQIFNNRVFIRGIFRHQEIGGKKTCLQTNAANKARKHILMLSIIIITDGG